MGFDEEISRIELLLESDERRSLIYAAIECRFVLEAFAYQRFRVSEVKTNKALYDWRPKQILDALMKEVGLEVVRPIILSISSEPIRSEPQTASDYEEVNYVEVGRQSELNVRLLNKHWHSMSSFLHYSSEQLTDDRLEKLFRRVTEALEFIKDANAGTIVMGPIDGSISLVCQCGTKISRAETSLKENQLIACHNPDCSESFLSEQRDDGWYFERRSVQAQCRCGALLDIPAIYFDKLRGNQHLLFDCKECGEKTLGKLEPTIKQAKLT